MFGKSLGKINVETFKISSSETEVREPIEIKQKRLQLKEKELELRREFLKLKKQNKTIKKNDNNLELPIFWIKIGWFVFFKGNVQQIRKIIGV
ncbi:MAG: hypothetical protein QXO57_02630 [Candidatus Aenigmatarchaeota archaeon]